MSDVRRRAPLGRDYFERLYERSDDPWGFETSAYERAKYRRTLEALDNRRFHRALEVGCSIGVFTALLAPRCDELVAIDVSERAIARARARLAGVPGVRLVRAGIPAELPPGPFDLIVCSEVLYYLTADVLRNAAAALEEALAPGGTLLAVHWTEPTRHYPLQGDEVHDLLTGQLNLDLTYSLREQHFRLDRWEQA